MVNNETKIEVNEDFDFIQTLTKSETTTVVSPSIDIIVRPLSKIRMTVIVFEKQFKKEMLSHFTMHSAHPLILNCKENLHHSPAFKDLHFQRSSIKNGIESIFNDHTQVLMNIPTAFISNDYEMEIVLSDAESIENNYDTTQTIRNININDLQSPNHKNLIFI